MASAAELMGSALRVLRALASLVASVLLALDLARVACDEARLLQHRPELGMRQDQRTRDAVTNGGRLGSHAPASHVHRQIVLTPRIGELEWLVHDHPRGLATEVVLQRALIDDQLALA